MEAIAMKKIFAGLFLVLGVSLFDLAGAQALDLSERVMLSAPTAQSVIDTNWHGFFRDYRNDDVSYDVTVAFRFGRNGDVLAYYYFLYGNNGKVSGLARGNFAEDALVLVDVDPDPYYSYVFKHFGADVLLGQIFTRDENGGDVEVGFIYLEK